MVSQIFRPSRFSSLIVADAKNLSRDPILLLVMVMSALMPVLFTTFKADLNQFGLQFFDLPNLSTYVAPIAFLMPAYLIGWVFGFLLLEDRDDHTLLAVETTAVGKQGFLIYRLTIASIISAILACYSSNLYFAAYATLFVFGTYLDGCVANRNNVAHFARACGQQGGRARAFKTVKCGRLVSASRNHPQPIAIFCWALPELLGGRTYGPFCSEAYLPQFAALLLAIIIHLAWIAFMFTKTINKAEQL